MREDFLTKRKLTRKEFLKLGATSAGAIVLSEAAVAKKVFAGEAGKIQEEAERLEKGKADLASTQSSLLEVEAKLAEREAALKEKEKDFNSWIMREAMRSGQKPDKVAKDLGKDREQLRAIQQQLLFDKALDFLVAKATVKTATAKA